MVKNSILTQLSLYSAPSKPLSPVLSGRLRSGKGAALNHNHIPTPLEIDEFYLPNYLILTN